MLLQWFAEWGGVAGLLVVGLMILGLLRGARYLREQGDSMDAGLWLALVSVLVLAQVDGVFVMPFTQTVLALLVGIAMARWSKPVAPSPAQRWLCRGLAVVVIVVLGRVLLLEGCVQPALSPNTNAAAARVLDRLGISVTPAAAAGCCGALDFHLDAQERGRQRARRNIDAWWPLLREGAEAIVQTASGCGAFVKDYAYLLRDDPRYADKAHEVAAAARDLVEVLRDEPLESLGLRCDQRLAFHCPCTLQHAQRLGGAVEAVLRRLGFHLTEVADGHLCCGSAGTYSLTQPALSRRLRDNRLDALESGAPDVIATANVGCQAHLDGAGRTPVRHWIELLDQALPGGE
ncbi:glycolate oxidase subunit GlcF, partial [Pseudomonas aeruginosa]|uniref:glycolate oxidase subunit GlcF n=1 Tax=Pseudomonas aeruginosa TaxID=287 RepID=UPI0020CA50A7